MREIQCEVKKQFGTISSSSKGWTKEVNLVSWNGAAPKYDIRDWAPEHEKSGRGVTLTEDEARSLYVILREIFA